MAKLGAGYRKRKDGRIEYRWTAPDGKRYSVTGKTLAECKQKEKEKKDFLEKTAYKGNATITLDDYFKEWQKRRRGSVKETTLFHEICLYKIISEEIGKQKLCKIEKRQIQLFQEQLKERYSVAYSNDLIKLLRYIFTTAEQNEIIEKNPCKGIKLLSGKAKPARETIHRALTVEETAEFFEAAKKENSWYYELYLFLINSGCRIGEAGALTRADIDYKNNMLHIRRTVTRTEIGSYDISDTPKTKASKRDIPLTPAIINAIKNQEKKNREVIGNAVELNGRIFTTINGSLILPRQIDRDIDIILKETNIERFSVHAFRDTFATRAIESGMNPRTLQDILGHSSYSMTMDLYAHVLENTKQQEMNVIQIRTGTN